MSETNPQVDRFIGKAKQWQAEYTELRRIALACELSEDYKWMHPCYTFEDSNIVIIQGFKHYCALLFPKGVLLKDPEKVLIAMTENVQASRQMRFTSVEQIRAMEAAIKDYIREAIEVEKAGLEVPMKDTSEFEVPEEFQMMLDEIPELKDAFEALTPGRQRGYLLYFAGAKQAKTRAARVEKMMDRIFEGKGLNDR